MKDKFNMAATVFIQEFNIWREKINSYEDYEGGIQTICELLHEHPFYCSDKLLNRICVPFDPEKIEQLIYFNMPKYNYTIRKNKKQPEDKWIAAWTLKKDNKYIEIELYGPSYAVMFGSSPNEWSHFAFDYDTIESYITNWN